MTIRGGWIEILETREKNIQIASIRQRICMNAELCMWALDVAQRG